MIYIVLSEEKTSNLKFIVRRKKAIILPLPSYMTAKYIDRPKTGHQFLETFINVFVFFTPHLHQRISIFANLCVTMGKVCAPFPWFAATAMLGRTIHWKTACPIIIIVIFQYISKFPYFSFSGVSFPCTLPWNFYIFHTNCQAD